MAVKPIIIPLVADTAGLTVGIEALEQLGTIDAKTASDFKAASKAFADRGKTLSDTAVATDKLVTASKKLGESIIGGGINKAADDLKKYSDALKNIPKVLVPGGAKADLAALKTQFAAGKLQVDALATSISLAKKKLQELEPESKAFNQLEAELKASLVANELLNKSFTSTRSQLKSMREALIQLEDAGLEGTKVFENIAVAAGELDDQVGDTQARIKALGSDTFKFDAAIQAVQGLAGAFSIAQGAAALFGQENEDVQKALLKVQAAMAILNGLQQIQQLIQKESSLSIAASIALQRVQALQTNLQAASESRFIIVRYAAAAAQRVLNAVMAANPAGVVLFAIAALATALVAFTSNTDDAAEAQAKMNQELETYIKISELSAKVTKQQGDVIVAALEARGASSKTIREAETQNLRQEVLNAKDAYDKASSDLASYGNDTKKLSQEQLVQRVKTQQLQQEAAQKYFELENNLQVKRLNNKTADNKEIKELDEKRIEDLKKAQEEEKKAIEKFLRDQVAANEIAVIEATNGFDKLVAQFALINAKLRLELANTDLGPNERLAAELRAGEEIKKARQDLLGDLKTVNSQQLAVNKEGQVEIRKATIDGEVLTSAQVAAARLQQEQAAAQERIKLTEQEEEQKKIIRQQATEASFQLAASLLQSISEISKNNTDAQIQSLQEQLDKGLITQQQFDQKSRAIRRKAAQEEKQLAIFQATINAAAAIVKVFATTPPPLSFILAATTAAATLAQIAAISSKPIPAFKKGTRDAPGGPSLVGEAGPELIYSNGNWQYASRATVLDLPKHAKVIPTLDTERILSKYDIPMPSIQQHVNTSVGGINIDYQKLSHVFDKSIAKLPLQQFNLDEGGFSKYQTKVAGRNNYINGKFKSPSR